MSTQIVVNDHGAIAELAAFPGLAKKATARALSRTADWSRVRTVNAVVKNLAVKRSDLDGRHSFGGITSSKANMEKLEAKVNITGARIPVFRFQGKPDELPEGKPEGASWQIDAGGGRKFSEDAFFARFKSGHAGLFWNPGTGARVKIVARSGRRAGKSVWSQRGIRELLGPSIPHVAENRPEFKKLLEVDAGERLELQVAREVNFILHGTSKVEGGEGG